MKSKILTLAELGPELVLAPERHVAVVAEGVPLGDLCEERGERVADLAKAIVLDTTHVKDGVVDLRSARHDGAGTKSVKKRACAGDLLISRLRPYLRQIALVPPLDRELAVSSEFYVLRGDDLAWLLPVLLGQDIQSRLAGAQEGGHHPRVPKSSLFALPIPHEAVRKRRQVSRAVRAAIDAHYRASKALDELLG